VVSSSDTEPLDHVLGQGDSDGATDPTYSDPLYYAPSTCCRSAAKVQLLFARVKSNEESPTSTAKFGDSAFPKGWA
jgi:hypothetical protein